MGAPLNAPLDAERFAALMAPLAPFDAAPRLAVGVSGGPDSLALALLANDWAQRRGGHAVALTVNHGLRPEAADEARKVAAWMTAAGMAHESLTVPGPAPSSGVQAWARARRLEALEAACRRLGLLDLLLAHHRDDQAETVLQRLGQGSGPDGLSAMAPVVFRSGVRLLRPLLTVPAEDLQATLRTLGRPWIDDPSNVDPTHQRVRVRALGQALAEAGVTWQGVAMAAGRAAEQRGERAERIAARLLAAVRLHPAGVAAVTAAPLLAPPDSEARAALGRLLACIGGGARPPRADALDRVLARLRTGTQSGLTLGRCRLRPLKRAESQADWLVWREARHLPAPVPLPDLPTMPADGWLWDGRFRVMMVAPEPGWTLEALGAGAANPLGTDRAHIPRAALGALPVLRGPDGEICVPAGLGYAGGSHGGLAPQARFAPRRPLVEGTTRLV